MFPALDNIPVLDDDPFSEETISNPVPVPNTSA